MIRNPGDANILDGLRSNFLRIAADYYQGNFICKWVTPEGLLSSDKEKEVEVQLEKIINDGTATIDATILDPLFRFIRYYLLGAFHLTSRSFDIRQDAAKQLSESRKRKRIVLRMARGYTPRKKRCFPMSKLKASFSCYAEEDFLQQLNVLSANVIIEKPSVRSVQLVHNFSLEALAFLEKSCGLDGNAIMDLQQKISLLEDP